MKMLNEHDYQQASLAVKAVLTYIKTLERDNDDNFGEDIEFIRNTLIEQIDEMIKNQKVEAKPSD